MEFKAAEEIIVNDKITLKRFSHDVDQVKYDTIVANREHLLPWLPWAHGYAKFEEMGEFTDLMIKCFDEGSVLGYDIFYEGKFAGSIDLHNLSATNRSCEIGYWLSNDFTGKGIATQATEKLVQYAFDSLDMHRVVIQAASKNKASYKVAERLGFKHEGTLREDELLDREYYDTEVYSKLANEQ